MPAGVQPLRMDQGGRLRLPPVAVRHVDLAPTDTVTVTVAARRDYATITYHNTPEGDAASAHPLELWGGTLGPDRTGLVFPTGASASGP